ncbi:hypothetical protein NPIL_119361 [Nephila pilipes]|uniref:DUF19 domain-containing protein n=1 Tax=Nephila pilipes TaxID=299642 RepID=A0A8X6PXG6_NEPPI|nr:hypothetical protein NPIL_119361 [Nephila pilipes]
MLVFILILLGAKEGLSETNDLCGRSNIEECLPKHNISFPSSEEEINMLCPRVLKHQECLLNYTRNCGEVHIFKIDFTVERQQMAFDIMKEICKMDSVLHSNVSDHIGCLYNVTEYHSSNCSQTFRSRKDNLIQYIFEREGNYDELDEFGQHRLWESFGCLEKTLFLTCYSAQTLEKCGAGAQELVLHLLYGIEFFEQFCPISKREDVNELLNIMKLDADDVRSLEELLAGQSSNNN